MLRFGHAPLNRRVEIGQALDASASPDAFDQLVQNPCETPPEIPALGLTTTVTIVEVDTWRRANLLRRYRLALGPPRCGSRSKSLVGRLILECLPATARRVRASLGVNGVRSVLRECARSGRHSTRLGIITPGSAARPPRPPCVRITVWYSASLPSQCCQMRRRGVGGAGLAAFDRVHAGHRSFSRMLATPYFET
jgi:hypothetical protein